MPPTVLGSHAQARIRLEARVTPRPRTRDDLGALRQDGANHKLPQVRLYPDLPPTAELAPILAGLGDQRRVPGRPASREGEGRHVDRDGFGEKLGELDPALLDEHGVELVEAGGQLLLDRFAQLHHSLRCEHALQQRKHAPMGALLARLVELKLVLAGPVLVNLVLVALRSVRRVDDRTQPVAPSQILA